MTDQWVEDRQRRAKEQDETIITYTLRNYSLIYYDCT